MTEYCPVHEDCKRVDMCESQRAKLIKETRQAALEDAARIAENMEWDVPAGNTYNVPTTGRIAAEAIRERKRNEEAGNVE